MRYGITPRRMASSWLPYERRERLAQHTPHLGGNVRGRARMDAGDAGASLQAPRRLGCRSMAAVAQRSSMFATRLAMKRTRPNSRGAPATLTLLDVPLHVWHRTVRYFGRVSRPRPEQQHCSV